MAIPTTLFLYGTLTDADVLARVMGLDAGRARRIDVRAATLHGFAVAALAGRDFPGLWVEAGAQTSGIVLDVTRRDMMRFNAYESQHYQLQPVDVVQDDGGQIVPAHTYMAKSWVQRGGPWSLEDWQRSHKAAYMQKWFG